MLGEPAWRKEGEEPDYRFSLANERTFLAWIRTALAVLAAGVLLDQFSGRLQPPVLVTGLATLLCLLAAVLASLSYSRWRRNEVAMRHKTGLPWSTALPILACAIFAVAAVLGVMVLLAQIRGG